MAVAEARAVWQRTANRCFVQEDAKRAPKLACCQSSSSSSKQVDGGPTNAADMPENPAVSFMPFHRSSSYSNLSPDTRWWLQLQPSYGYQKGLTYEQLNALEAEMESVRTDIVNTPSKFDDVPPHDDRRGACFSGNMNSESSSDAYCRISTNRIVKDPETKNQEANTLYNMNDQEFIEFKDTREKWMDIDPIEFFQPQKSNEYGFDPESPWLGGEKNVPWWRTTDKDELASLVAQKSLDYIENCDLPPPQKLNVRRYPCGRPVSSDQVHDRPNYETMHGRQRTAIKGQLQSSSEKPFSYIASHKDTTEIGQLHEGDPSKAQLMEALRHSQTRAREAEKVARQACAEKEHIIKLFFRQASQLFAYKQWFQMLQLETLYYQVKNGDQPMSTLFPVVLPWMPLKGRKHRKSWQKSPRTKRGKHCRPSHDISKYAVAFALGLSLVGAGLLLGWTVGWMLPL